MEVLYNQQMDIIKSEKKQRVIFLDGLQFGDLLNDANFIDAGPGTGAWRSPTTNFIDLQQHNNYKRISAVEFDNSLVALMDFGSLDCIKGLSLSSGVE